MIEWLLSDCCAARAALEKKWVSLLRECLQSLATEVKVKHADPCPHTSLFIFLVKGSQSGPDGVRDPHRPSATPLLLYFWYPVQVWRHTHKKNPLKLLILLDFIARKGFSSCLRDEHGGTACGWPQYITKWIIHLFDAHVSEKKKKTQSKHHNCLVCGHIVCHKNHNAEMVRHPELTLFLHHG